MSPKAAARPAVYRTTMRKLLALLWPLILLALACSSDPDAPAGSAGATAPEAGNGGAAVTPAAGSGGTGGKPPADGEAGAAGAAGESELGQAGSPEGGAAGAAGSPDAGGAAGEAGSGGAAGEAAVTPQPGAIWQGCDPGCADGLTCEPYMPIAGAPAPERVCAFLCVTWHDGIGAGYWPDYEARDRCTALGGTCYSAGGNGAEACVPHTPTDPYAQH